MQVFFSLDNLPLFERSVITIGSFDGVHAGHQFILENLKRLAHERGGEPIVITFEPHPRLVLEPTSANSLALLTTVEEKIGWIQEFGIKNIVVVPFTRQFADQSPEDYIEYFLIQKFKPQSIVIGYDHRFGANRVGDISYLKKFSSKYNFEIIEIEKQLIDEIAISSTKIRKAIENADLATATKLLGHSFTFTGEVVKGNQLGRTIGFPTANIDVQSPHKLVPPLGVYAVWVWVNGKKYRGMLNRGKRPTVSVSGNVIIEVHILDFSADIYGEKVKIELVQWLRAEQAFEGLAALKQQLFLDLATTKAVLAS